MFSYTFSDCNGLTGSVPGKLFSGITGAPAAWMFESTFQFCNMLTGIGDGLFDGITGAVQTNMFRSVFGSCSSLTGPSATSDGQFLYEKWPGATTSHVMRAYQFATKLSDYAQIPAAWK